MSKRNEIEITANILKIAISGAKKSHIVYKANLNFKLIEKYLDTLTKTDLISGPIENRLYKTTEKGLKYIDHFESFQKYLKTPELTQPNLQTRYRDQN